MDRAWYFRFSIVAATVALAWLSLWPSIDKWVPAPSFVKNTFKGKIVPGLDIRGGLRLVYEAEVDEAIRDIRDTRAEQLLESLGRKLNVIPERDTPTRAQLDQVAERVTVKRNRDDHRKLQVVFKKTSDLKALDRDLLRNLGDLKEVGRDANTVSLEVREDRLQALRDDAVQQAKRTIVNRIDELQLRQTSVASRETDIIIEIPGEDEATFQLTRDIIGRTAQLEFKVLDDESDFVATLSDLPEGIQALKETVPTGTGKSSTSSYLMAQGKGAKQKLSKYLKSLRDAERVPEDHQLLMGSETLAQGLEPGEEPTTLWRTYYLFSRSEVGGDEIEDAWVTQGQRPEDPPFSYRLTSKNRVAQIFLKSSQKET
ncbi:MAG: hypothetical protein IPJ88_15910 [Myxococcales bacterium]|nr:MAG: hypothetical protein IPJ88_15910 [Myxococcales bacterium]